MPFARSKTNSLHLLLGGGDQEPIAGISIFFASACIVAPGAVYAHPMGLGMMAPVVLR